MTETPKTPRPSTVPETLTFVEAPAALLNRGRGRPALFNETIKAALAERPGEFAVIQQGLKSASRASVLKRTNVGFEFLPVKQEDGTFQILARVPAPVVEAPAEKTAAKRVRAPRKPKAAAAE